MINRNGGINYIKLLENTIGILNESKYQEYFSKSLKKQYGTSDFRSLTDEDKNKFLKYINATYNSKVSEPGRSGINQSKIKAAEKDLHESYSYEEDDFFAQLDESTATLAETPSQKLLSEKVEQLRIYVNEETSADIRLKSIYNKVLTENGIKSIDEVSTPKQKKILETTLSRFQNAKEQRYKFERTDN